jgi:hypothetical protein
MYRWDAGGKPISMLSVDENICALKKVAGRFDGKDDWVEVASIDGVWTLRGSAAHAGIMAEAHCVSKANFQFTPQMAYGGQASVWATSPNQYRVTLTQNSASKCWLMGIGGDLSTSGASVDFDMFTPPVLDLFFVQFEHERPLFGAAQCLNVTPAPKLTYALWDGGAPGGSQPIPLPGTAEAFCYLTHVQGKFTGTTPASMTYAGISSADWNPVTRNWKGQYLSAGNIHGPPGYFTVGVNCIYFNGPVIHTGHLPP